jgi:hypothetical protein
MRSPFEQTRLLFLRVCLLFHWHRSHSVDIFGFNDRSHRLLDQASMVPSVLLRSDSLDMKLERA